MATNPYVNKVVYGNQTVMDISDTTANEADVAEGEVFYKGSGQRSVGTGNYYSPNDTAETDIADGDYFPFYDTSASAKRKTLWSNILAKIKLLVNPVRQTLTKAQYDALPSADKTNLDNTFYVPDYEDTSKTWVALDDTTTANDKVWSSSKVSSVIAGTAQIDDTTTSQTKVWSSTKVATEIDNKQSYSVNDTTETTLDDADFVPFYDYSAAAKKKSTWANIIAKIKTKLATVATTGSYNDLSNKPSIPAAQIQSDWNQTTTTAKDYIKNKPTIPSAQVNSDWNSSSGVSEILNKPTLATVATSGAYSDLTGTPTLATVATSGDYDDLVDAPAVETPEIGGLTRSLVTTGEKYKWASTYNERLKWYTGSALTGATSVSIGFNDYEVTFGDVVVLLADDGTNKPVKYTSIGIVESLVLGSSVVITFPALAHDTSFKVGMM